MLQYTFATDMPWPDYTDAFAVFFRVSSAQGGPGATGLEQEVV